MAGLLLLGTFGAVANAQTQVPSRSPDERSGHVDETLHLSQLKTNLASIRARLVDALGTDRSNPETRQWIAGSLKAAYAPDEYLRAVREALLARL